MFRAINNELYKVFAGKKIYVLSFVMILASIAMALIMKKISTIEDAKLVVLNAQSYPMSFFSQIGSIIYPVLIVIAVGGSICDEYRDGTLKLTLLAPVTRMELLAAKIFTVIASNVFMLAMTMLGCYAVSYLVFGSSTEFVLNDTVLKTGEGIIKTIEYYGIILIPATVFGMLVLLVSQLISNSGIVVGLSIGIYFFQFILQNLSANLRHFLLTTYFSIGHSILKPDFNKYLISMFFTCSAYLILILLIAIVNFKRRDMLT